MGYAGRQPEWRSAVVVGRLANGNGTWCELYSTWLSFTAFGNAVRALMAACRARGCRCPWKRRATWRCSGCRPASSACGATWSGPSSRAGGLTRVGAGLVGGLPCCVSVLHVCCVAAHGLLSEGRAQQLVQRTACPRAYRLLAPAPGLRPQQHTTTFVPHAPCIPLQDHQRPLGHRAGLPCGWCP